MPSESDIETGAPLRHPERAQRAEGSPSGKLIICPTPLGNLGDVTQRSLDALAAAGVVCCEDTRVTGKLLAALGIEGVRLERLDEATLGAQAQATVQRVLAGETVVYCSDAGMPGVSDPGQRLVSAARAAGVPVEVLPGPSAVTTAYVASGFTAPSFFFGGFFPRKAGDRAALLQQLSALDAALVFYESPNRIVSALEAVAKVLPLRQVAVCRELTKLHEEVLLGTAAELTEQLSAREAIKGEITFVVDASSAEEKAASAADVTAQATERARELLSNPANTPKGVTKLIQAEFGIPRNTAYELVQILKNSGS